VCFHAHRIDNRIRAAPGGPGTDGVDEPGLSVELAQVDGLDSVALGPGEAITHQVDSDDVLDAEVASDATRTQLRAACSDLGRDAEVGSITNKCAPRLPRRAGNEPRHPPAQLAPPGGWLIPLTSRGSAPSNAVNRMSRAQGQSPERCGRRALPQCLTP
jgi:hypothetical protein